MPGHTPHTRPAYVPQCTAPHRTAPHRTGLPPVTQINPPLLFMHPSYVLPCLDTNRRQISQTVPNKKKNDLTIPPLPAQPLQPSRYGVHRHPSHKCSLLEIFSINPKISNNQKTASTKCLSWVLLLLTTRHATSKRQKGEQKAEKTTS